MLVLGIVLLVVALGMLITLIQCFRAIPELATRPLLEGEAPRVSVVIAARDEAARIERALTSVLRQEYANYEVIVVDDRSTDGTSDILDRIATREPRLHVVHIHSLPDEWLGKNHALQRGAESSSGELLLFTDADVVLEPTTLSRAVRLMRDRRLDHVALGPDLVLPTRPLQLAGGFFTMSFMLYLQPWRATDPRSDRHIGIGAFNLVRADMYQAIGGHAPIALRPDDDVKLGKLVKMGGGRQLLASGNGLVSVEWYATLGEFVHGLRKNSFAGFEYSVPRWIGSTAASLLLHVWPFVGAVVLDGVPQMLHAAACVVLVIAFAYTLRKSRAAVWLSLFFPLGALLVLWVVGRAVVATLVSGGIEWRGTRYSLEALRANEV
jgi:hypothetical protein